MAEAADRFLPRTGGLQRWRNSYFQKDWTWLLRYSIQGPSLFTYASRKLARWPAANRASLDYCFLCWVLMLCRISEKRKSSATKNIDKKGYRNMPQISCAMCTSAHRVERFSHGRRLSMRQQNRSPADKTLHRGC